METVSCNICGSNENILLFSQRDLMFEKNDILFNVVKCKECELMFTNPRPTEEEMSFYYPDEYHYIPGNKINSSAFDFYDVVKREILSKYYGYNVIKQSKHFLDTLYLELCNEIVFFLFRLFRKNISLFPYKKDGRLLDVGCGSGSSLLFWKEMGWNPYGVEIGHAAAKFARNELNLNVYEGTLLDANFKNRYFDVITFNNSLEHMHNPMQILLEANRILKDDGLLIISVPNTECLDAKLYGRFWSPWDLPRHLFHFNRETFCRLLGKVSFSPIKMISDFTPKNSLLNLSFYLKHSRKINILPKVLFPLAVPLEYFGQGNVLYIHAKKNFHSIQ